MTFLDQAALAALQGLLASGILSNHPSDLARKAYEIARAMQAESLRYGL